MSRKKITTSEFIEKAKAVHGDRYDYSLSKYKKMHEKLDIICPIHGVFSQTAHSHLGGQGCPKCAIEKRAEKKSDNLPKFIEKAKKVHGNKYDYSKVVYRGSQEKVCIICPEHGEFWQRPYAHIIGNGCKKCHFEKLNKKDTMLEFIEKAKKVHGDKYDYSKVEYNGTNVKVTIICPKHGEFEQTPNVHLAGHGCPLCGLEKSHEIMSNETFIEKAKAIHGDKYDYSNIEYKGPFEYVSIICPKHGEFKQKASYHLSGNGCPKCVSNESKWEKEIYDYIKEKIPQLNVVENDRSVLNGMEIDIYIPELKIGFECDGLYWHNEINKEKNYHRDKTNECNKKGIRLIHIFEDEWIYRNNVVKGRIDNLLGVVNNRIYARKCSVKEVKYKDVSEFIEKNHIQGKIPFRIGYGLYYNDELVSIMVFGCKRKNLGSVSSDGSYEMLRYCNKIGVSVIGGASKMFKHFLKENSPKEVISYCDLRWGNGDIYELLGMKMDHISQPNYFYVVGDKRKNRFNFRKNKLIEDGFDANKSEHEIMLERCIYRIYDCGCKVYSLQS